MFAHLGQMTAEAIISLGSMLQLSGQKAGVNVESSCEPKYVPLGKKWLLSSDKSVKLCLGNTEVGCRGVGCPLSGRKIVSLTGSLAFELRIQGDARMSLQYMLKFVS